MIRSNLFSVCVAITLLLGLPGCALILAPNYQEVAVVSAEPGTTIKHDGDSVGIDKAKIKANKNRIEEVVGEKDGYKTTHYCFETKKLSPFYALTILDIITLGPLSEETLPKLHDFDKTQKIPQLPFLEKRKENEKYLLVETTAIDAKGSDMNFVAYRSIKGFNKRASHQIENKPARIKVATQDDMKMDNTIFTDELNKTLKKMNFIDTTKTIFPNTGNCMYLNSTIKKICLHEIVRDNKAVCVELEINWDILDFYKQKIDSITTRKRSDLIVVNLNNKESYQKTYSLKIAEAIRNNLEYALIDVRKELSDKGFLTITAEKADTSAYIPLMKPAVVPNQKLNDFMKSSVTIKVDAGHGSGFIVSSDGYIVTNYHVIAGTKNVEVIFNDGSKANAEIVRKNSIADLALIKVKKDSLEPLLITDAKDPEIGIDVWTIGTPKSLELGQSVSKGIISGVRTANNMTYLQTDVKISPGNSGGALINANGTVLGVVSSKLIGFGTEGVGFAIPASTVLSSLHLLYK